MPTITHSIVGGALALIFFTITNKDQGNQYLSNKKVFKKEHVIIFALNSFIGPDFAKILSPFYSGDYWESVMFHRINGTLHTVLGWILVAPLFAGIYYTIFRYMTQEGKINGNAPISYTHTLLLIIAAGMNHFGMDMLDNTIRVFPYYIPNTSEYAYTLSDFFTGNAMAEGVWWNSLSWFDTKFYLILGLIFMIILIWMMNKKKSIKKIWFTSLFFGALVYGLIFGIG